LEGLDFRIVAAAITAFASIGVFFGGRFVALLADRAKARARRNALVSAVFTEIRHNLEDLEDSIGDLIGNAELCRHFENKPNGNVLIVYSRNMVFFDLLRGRNDRFANTCLGAGSPFLQPIGKGVSILRQRLWRDFSDDID
jgi:hypothetical protein